ncbi:uncharacterized protein LOC123988859 [Osmia bicornis bicornis]|uniref:uncharacterized protein LOC123988859 n=1 Tax=Osmia bicornis bicornis TaxID=1437191 RepID=UPI001EAF8851|nr:uncharacterized protein LOC123988859 [Osmia bicornis bicornis]
MGPGGEHNVPTSKSKRDWTTSSTNKVSEELVVCSAYLPYDSEEPPPTRELRALTDHCAVNGLHLVIGCDVNSHHTVWGSTNTNGRGTALLEYLATTGLEILNLGSSPTFVTSRRQEVIDLTLGSAKVTQVNKQWKIRDESTLSDHRLITFRLTGDREGGTGEAYRNPKATNWALYREGLEGRLKGNCQRPRTVGETEQEVEHLSSAITQAYEAACPARTRNSSKRVPWWNKKLDQARKDTRSVAEDRERRRSGTARTDPVPADWVMAEKVINTDRVRWAIGSFKRFKSPGTDGIFPAFLQEGGEDLYRRLGQIFKSCLAMGYVPKAWRYSKVVFIPKPGKHNYGLAKSYRPISLTSFMLKMLERLVDRYIRDEVLVSKPLHPSQHAYQTANPPRRHFINW